MSTRPSSDPAQRTQSIRINETLSPPYSQATTHFSLNNVTSATPSATLSQALNPIPPWLQTSLSPLQTLFLSHLTNPFATLIPPGNQGHEVIARQGRLRHQRQDGGCGSGSAGTASEIQETGQEEEEVPGSRPGKPIQAW